MWLKAVLGQRRSPCALLPVVHSSSAHRRDQIRDAHGSDPNHTHNASGKVAVSAVKGLAEDFKDVLRSWYGLELRATTRSFIASYQVTCA